LTCFPVTKVILNKCKLNPKKLKVVKEQEAISVIVKNPYFFLENAKAKSLSKLKEDQILK
jgi:hypothetical protein